jgi:hypothetical protein
MNQDDDIMPEPPLEDIVYDDNNNDNLYKNPSDKNIDLNQFQIRNTPVFINSDKYANINFHSEPRMRSFLNMYPPLQNKKYHIMSSNPFSIRFYNWMRETCLDQLGENYFYLTNYRRSYHSNICVESNNRLIKIDDNVYCITYKEHSGYSENTIIENGIVFVENETPWDADRIRNWMVCFSKKLKDFDDLRSKNRIDPSAFNGLFLPDEILNDVVNEINDFINSRELYKNNLELPWKRGYMLIGPPGNGKTSLIRSICKYWGLQSTDIQKAIQKDGTIDLNIFTYGSSIDMILYPPEQNPVICIMEDIDKFIVYQSGGSRGNADSGKVTLHDILKALDGMDQYDGVIVIATTNYAKDMSEAILNRPGRFDRIWEITAPLEHNILKLLEYYNIELDNKNLDIIAKELKGFSMAFVAEFIKSIKMKFRRNKISYDEAKIILNNIHNHNKIYLDYFKGKDKDHRDSGSVGF